MATDVQAIVGLCSIYLRMPVISGRDAQGNIVATFEPPLTSAEQLTFNRIVNMAKSLISGITPAEWEQLEPDIAGLVTYQGLATPTLAQTVLAVKAQSRILRAMLKN